MESLINSNKELTPSVALFYSLVLNFSLSTNLLSSSVVIPPIKIKEAILVV